MFHIFHHFFFIFLVFYFTSIECSDNKSQKESGGPGLSVSVPSTPSATSTPSKGNVSVSGTFPPMRLDESTNRSIGKLADAVNGLSQGGLVVEKSALDTAKDVSVNIKGTTANLSNIGLNRDTVEAIDRVSSSINTFSKVIGDGDPQSLPNLSKALEKVAIAVQKPGDIRMERNTQISLLRSTLTIKRTSDSIKSTAQTIKDCIPVSAGGCMTCMASASCLVQGPNCVNCALLGGGVELMKPGTFNVWASKIKNGYIFTRDNYNFSRRFPFITSLKHGVKRD